MGGNLDAEKHLDLQCRLLQILVDATYVPFLHILDQRTIAVGIREPRPAREVIERVVPLHLQPLTNPRELALLESNKIAWLPIRLAGFDVGRCIP